jgi:hypothetical protein
MGFTCESIQGQQFRQAVLTGNWAAAVETAKHLRFASKQGKARVTCCPLRHNTCCLRGCQVLYLVEEQHVLQQLLQNDKVGALKLIRSRLTPAAIFK